MMRVGYLLLALHAIAVAAVSSPAFAAVEPDVWTRRCSMIGNTAQQQSYPSQISAAAGTRGQHAAFGFRHSSTSSPGKAVASATLEEAVEKFPAVVEKGVGAVDAPAPSR